MANNPYVNKVEFGDQTLMDITDTTATANDVVSGKVFYAASGARSVGSASIPENTSDLTNDGDGTSPFITEDGADDTYVKKTGDTMTGGLDIVDDQVPSSTPSSDIYGQKGLQLLDSNGNRVTFLLGEFLSNGYRGLNLGTVRNVNGNDVYNSINLYIDGSGNPQVYVSGASAWRTALNAVSKAGDTMTGALNIKDNSITIGNVPSTTIASNVGVHIQDSAGTDIGFLKPLYRKTDQSAVDIGTTRIINNVAKYNTINLAIDNAGNREVAVSDAAAWRSALAAVNKAGDTMTGALKIQATDITIGTLPSANTFSASRVTFEDSNGVRMGYLAPFYRTTDVNGYDISAVRTVNGTDVFNSLKLEIDARGNNSIRVTNPAAWRDALGVLPYNNNVSTSGVGCFGYLTSSRKQISFMVPYPLFSGTGFTISSLKLVVRHIVGTTYAYVRSGTNGETYTQLGSGATSVIANGEAVRSNEIASTKVWMHPGSGIEIGITFKYEVCSDNSGTVLPNNTPLIVAATLTGTIS